MTPVPVACAFIALLLFGAPAMSLAVAAWTVVQALTGQRNRDAIVQFVVNAIVGVGATQAAGLVYVSLGGTQAPFEWPWHGLPIAAAVVSYCLVTGGGTHMAVPIVLRRTVDRTWLRNPVRDCPSAFISAGIAVGLVELIARQAWEILPVAAVPLYLCV